MMSTPASVESTPLGRPRGLNKMIELAPAVARAAESTGSGSGLLKYPPHADAAAVARSGRDDARSERGLGERAERGHCLTPSFFGLRAERTAGERAALQRRSGAKSRPPGLRALVGLGWVSFGLKIVLGWLGTSPQRDPVLGQARAASRGREADVSQPMASQLGKRVNRERNYQEHVCYA
jgi:hypothetical protein